MVQNQMPIQKYNAQPKEDPDPNPDEDEDKGEECVINMCMYLTEPV